MSEEHVKIINRGETRIASHGMDHYTLKTDVPAIVPFRAAKFWCGDPTRYDTPNNAARSEEFKRVRTSWGHLEGFEKFCEPWDEMKPQLEVWTLEDERVMMVLDDPTGGAGTLNLPHAPVSAEHAALAGEVVELRTQVKDLLAFLTRSVQSSDGGVDPQRLAELLAASDSTDGVLNGAGEPDDAIPSAPEGTGATADAPRRAGIRGAAR